MDLIVPSDILSVPAERGGYGCADAFHFSYLLDAAKVVQYARHQLIRCVGDDAAATLTVLSNLRLRPANGVEVLAFGICFPQCLEGQREICGVGTWAYQGTDLTDPAFVIIYRQGGVKCAAIDEVPEGIERERWILAFPL